jgi:hypothetical protein
MSFSLHASLPKFCLISPNQTKFVRRQTNNIFVQYAFEFYCFVFHNLLVPSPKDFCCLFYPGYDFNLLKFGQFKKPFTTTIMTFFHCCALEGMS